VTEQWLTSDLHLGHVNIIEYSGRPFENPDEMNEAIVDRWNSTVAQTDRVLVLGDVAMGKISDTLQIAGRLNGYKVLLTGNHDRCADFIGKLKTNEWVERYQSEGGFAEIHQGKMRIDLGAKHSIVLACHFPYEGDSTHELRYADQRPIDSGEWLIHGHVHEAWLQNGRQINVGLDAWGGRVVRADEVVTMIKAGPQELPRIDWTR
jgi:calcineurin-like phosphoesterase family protein